MADVAEIKEVQEQKMNPFDFVTIPLSEYRELVTAVAKKQIRKEYKTQIKDMQEDIDKYRRWWHEEEVEKAQLRKYLDDAKALIREKLNIDPDTEILPKENDNAES